MKEFRKLRHIFSVCGMLKNLNKIKELELQMQQNKIKLINSSVINQRECR